MFVDEGFGAYSTSVALAESPAAVTNLGLVTASPSGASRNANPNSEFRWFSDCPPGFCYGVGR